MAEYSYNDNIPGYIRVMVQLTLGKNDKIDDVISYIDSNSQNFFIRDKSYKPVCTKKDLDKDFYTVRGHLKDTKTKDLESLSYVYKLYLDDKIGPRIAFYFKSKL